MLKAESRLNPPVNLNLRGEIEDIEATFPHPPVFAAYDRSTLFQGDIVPDFADRFLAPLIGAVDLPPLQANLGLSAEALVLMARLRVEGGNTVEAARRVARLKGHFLEFDRMYPLARPLALLTEVAEAALRSATCYRWLAETGRLHIPGLDTGKIDGADVPDWMMTAAPETMFPHDPARLARLRQSIDQLGPSPVLGWNSGASKKSLPRLRDRFLQFLNRKLAAFNQRASGRAAEPPPPGKPASKKTATRLRAATGPDRPPPALPKRCAAG